MNKVVCVYKAQKIIGPVTGLELQAFDEIPNVATLEDARALYATQAAQIADALFVTLPGGTVDALLVEMLRRKASLFVVPHVMSDYRDGLT